MAKGVSCSPFAPVPNSLEDLVVFHRLLWYHVTLNLSSNLMFSFLV